MEASIQQSQCEISDAEYLSKPAQKLLLKLIKKSNKIDKITFTDALKLLNSTEEQTLEVLNELENEGYILKIDAPTQQNTSQSTLPNANPDDLLLKQIEKLTKNTHNLASILESTDNTQTKISNTAHGANESYNQSERTSSDKVDKKSKLPLKSPDLNLNSSTFMSSRSEIIYFKYSLVCKRIRRNQIDPRSDTDLRSDKISEEDQKDLRRRSDLRSDARSKRNANTTRIPSVKQNKSLRYEPAMDFAREVVRQIMLATRIAETENSIPPQNSNPENRLKAYVMAKTYESALAYYLNKPYMKFLRKNPNSFLVPRNLTVWMQAAAIADLVGVDYETYVKAQFYCFNTWYARPPKPYELRSYRGEVTAAHRVQLYFDAQRAGKIRPQTNIVSKAFQVLDLTTEKGVKEARKMFPESVIFFNSARQLKSLMKNYNMTEEEALRNFATHDRYLIFFDAIWLSQHPTYQRLRAEGVFDSNLQTAIGGSN